MTILPLANPEASRMMRALTITAEVLAYAFVICLIFMIFIESL